ncbi:uncharacterized protein DC041_0003566 [Schistosoma bovis]|uniref:Uncharacterized protein n=1 Tax=Schistosoma bovis TaxID=6184 RepID=A0A430QN83_SCHBO|nr:uncharacterized protein DC041_0003566 [Schistosoma bovis]
MTMMYLAQIILVTMLLLINTEYIIIGKSSNSVSLLHFLIKFHMAKFSVVAVDATRFFHSVAVFHSKLIVKIFYILTVTLHCLQNNL